MSEFRVALRYAKSLIDLAREKGVLEQVNQDMELFKKVGSENRAFLLMLKNPIVSHDKKITILKAIFKGRVNDLSIAIFEIIVRKHREEILHSVAKEFHNLYNKEKGIERAEVTTVVPLTPEMRNNFKNIIRTQFGKEVELEEKIDTSLLGGYILQVADKQIDESLKNKLKMLTREFTYHPYVKEF